MDNTRANNLWTPSACGTEEITDTEKPPKENSKLSGYCIVQCNTHCTRQDASRKQRVPRGNRFNVSGKGVLDPTILCLPPSKCNNGRHDGVGWVDQTRPTPNLDGKRALFTYPQGRAVHLGRSTRHAISGHSHCPPQKATTAVPPRVCRP